jgi:hypothetical protein
MSRGRKKGVGSKEQEVKRESQDFKPYFLTPYFLLLTLYH